MENQILEELWNVRRNIEKKCGKNINKLFQRYKRMQKNSGRKYFSGVLKKIAKTNAA